jgi:dihydropteroate synthase
MVTLLKRSYQRKWREKAINTRLREYRYRGLKLSFSHPLIMGVVNVTPDSFSGGGRRVSPRSAVALAEKLISEGADIIDIGGESTRPGAAPVSVKSELARVIPVIESLTRFHPQVPVSIDTSKPEVAQAALTAGACIINDVTGLSSHAMVELAARTQAPVVIMHMKGKPGDMAKKARYGDVVVEVTAWLASRAQELESRGVTKVILDPGIGFAKTASHNLALLNALERIVSLGYPVLIGASRKSFIGKILDKPVGGREAGTLAVTAIAVMKGASIIRVHDVDGNIQAARMAHCVRRGGI